MLLCLAIHLFCPATGAGNDQLINLAADMDGGGFGAVARELDEKDIQILRILAPECEEMICSGSGVEFRSILPPVVNHYSRSEEDFKKRLMRLTDGDITYLVGKIRTGEESVACVPPEYAEVLIGEISSRKGKDVADEVLDLYETVDEC